MMERCWIIILGLLLVLCPAVDVPAGEIQPALSRKLAALTPGEEVSVIITLTDQLNPKQFRDRNKKLRRSKINRSLRTRAATTQQPLKKFLQKKNARNIKSYWIFNGMAATLRADQVDELANRPEVRNVHLNTVHTLPPTAPSQAATVEWNLDAIHAPALWHLGFTGQGVVVASLDTGVDADHPDIGPKWRGGTNSWFDPHGQHPAVPYDGAGHGTAVMGVMVGGDAGGTAIGVAPGAQWIAVKIYNDAGFTSDAIILEGFQWLFDPDGNPETDDAPDVVNGSWGYDDPPSLVDECYHTVFEDVIPTLKTAGVAVVFSAGNSGPGGATSISPANYPAGFAVGSVDSALQIDFTSSRGPSACDGTVFPEMVAPGVGIRTADLFGIYTTLSGTSLAAPHVSGAMALLLGAAPGLTVAELEAVLKQSATDLGDPGPDNDYGYGLLNVDSAARHLGLKSFPWEMFLPIIINPGLQQ